MVLNSSTMSDATKPPQEAGMGEGAATEKQMVDASSAANNLASLRWNKSSQRLARLPAKSPSADKKAGKAVASDDAEEEEVTSTMLNLQARKSGRLIRQRTSVDAKMAAETKERMRFSLSLTPEEIEEDFLLMTGAKPARRPTRRNKRVQRDLDNLYPGSWLEAPLPDMYKTNKD